MKLKRFKKITGIVATAVLSSALLLPFGSVFASHEQGLLYGKNLNIASGISSTGSISGVFTDGDHSTYMSLSGSGGTTDTIWYEFSSPVNLKNYSIHTDSTNLEVAYYDSNGNELYDSFPPSGTSTSGIASISNVKKVAVINNGGTTATIYDFDVYASTETDTTAPTEVTNLTSIIGDSTVTLNYTLPTDADFSHVNIYKDDVLYNENVTTNSTVVEGLTNGQEYTFKVTTVDTTGNESTGTTITAIPQSALDVTPPSEVTNLTETHTDSTIDLMYTLPTDSDFSHVNIYLDGELQGTDTTGSYSLTGLTSETDYIVKVVAVDNTGNLSAGVSLPVTTNQYIDTVAPNAPTGLVLTLGSESAYLTWDKNLETDIAGYNVYIDGVKDNTTLLKSTSYTIIGLSNDIEHSFVVTAVDTSGNESIDSLVSLGTPTKDMMPILELGYELKDVADGVTTWFDSLWLILAFAVAIPLSLYIGARTKMLFLD